MTNLYCWNPFNLFSSCYSAPTVDNGNTSEDAEPNTSPSFWQAPHACAPSNPIGFDVTDYLEVSVEVSASDKKLESKPKTLEQMGISDKIIDFVRHTINNEPNEIIKKTIEDNLQRYATICQSLKDAYTFEAIKDELPKEHILNNDVLSVIQAQLSDPSIVNNLKQLQNNAYLILFSEQLSNDGIDVPRPLITQILDYVKRHQQDKPKHVGVIMGNLHWYALACHYHAPQGVATLKNTLNPSEFQSAQELLGCMDYTKLTQYFTIDKPKTGPTEKTITEYISHREYVKYLLTNPTEA